MFLSIIIGFFFKCMVWSNNDIYILLTFMTSIRNSRFNRWNFFDFRPHVQKRKVEQSFFFFYFVKKRNWVEGWLVWFLYLNVTIVAPYLLSNETLYSWSIKTHLLFFRPFKMKIKYKKYRDRDVTNYWVTNLNTGTYWYLTYQATRTLVEFHKLVPISKVIRI